MDTLKVCIFRFIACFNKCFKTAKHKVCDTTADNALLTEKVGFSLFIHSGFHYAGSCAAYTSDVSKCNIPGFSCGILFNSDKAGNAFSFNILGTYCVARSLGSCHKYVNSSRRDNLLITDIKAVSKCDSFSFCKVGLDILLIHIRLSFIIDKDHDDVCGFSGFRNSHYIKACFRSLRP